MTLLAILPIHGLALFLQAGISGWPTFGWAKPPFLLAAALYAALRYDRLTAGWSAVLAGLLQDTLGFVPLGVSSFGFLALAVGVYLLRPSLVRESFLTLLLLTAVGAALLAAWTWGLLRWGAVEEIPPFQVSPALLALKIAGQAILTPVAVFPIHLLSRWLERAICPAEEWPA